MTVGGIGRLMALGANLFPRLTDRAMELGGAPAQHIERPPAPDRVDNLYEARADGAIEDSRPAVVRRTSLWLEAQMHPRAADGGDLGPVRAGIHGACRGNVAARTRLNRARGLHARREPLGGCTRPEDHARMTALPRIALIASLALASACATQPGSDRIARKDPLERINRKIYKADRRLDKAVLRPVAVAYTKVVPEAGRRGITNAFNNLNEPETFVNAVLQAKPKVALRALARFVINSTLGIAGLADQATRFGIPAQREDFGQTFAVWGIGSGPYLVLPVLGPSTLRDAVGRGVEFAGGDPVQYGRSRLNLRWYVDYSITALDLINLRANLLDTADPVLKGAADEYATVRSAYLQERRNEIYDGHPPDEDDTSPADDPAPAVMGANAVPPGTTQSTPVGSPASRSLPPVMANPPDRAVPIVEPPVTQPR